jgi:hypothetical protein
MINMSTIFVVCLAALLAGGCSNDEPRQVTLKPASFYQHGGATTRPAGTETPRVAAANGSRKAASRLAASSPTTRPGSASMGTYMIVGTVVATANGTPIYADKVLAKIDPALKSKQYLEPGQFRRFAQGEIEKQVDQEIREELEYAAAEHFATDEDQQIATGATIQWRQKEITRHGGSLAITRDDYLNPPEIPGQAKSQPIDFDDKVREQFRRNMILIYYTRRVWPRVQVAAEDMRNFYDRFRNDLFAEKAGVLFRVIRFDVRRLGKENAQTKAGEVYAMATKPGAEFADLADRFGSDTGKHGLMFPPTPKKDKDGNEYVTDNQGVQYLRDERGHLKTMDGKVPDNEAKLQKEVTRVLEPLYIERGSLTDHKLDDAVFGLNKGEISGPTEGDNGANIYIIKCEDKRGGKVRQFEDITVQNEIRQRMETEQRQQLRQKEQFKLLKNARYWISKEGIDLAADMAMQKYYMSARAD